MGVIQYRRGERFDRVIVSKNEDHRPTTMVVKLNSHLQKIPARVVASSTAVSASTSAPANGKSLSALLRTAVELSAKQSKDPALRDLFKSPSTATSDAAKAQLEAATELQRDLSEKLKGGFLKNPVKYLFFVFIAFQILRAIFSN